MMHKRMAIVAAVLSNVALLLTGAEADAQFPGDVYFENPSIAVPQGGKGTLRVVAFVGAEPLGAAHVDLAYDPAKLTIAGSMGDPGFTFEASDEPGDLGLLALNNRALASPIGTVLISEVEVQPLGAPGDRIPLSLSVRRLLRTNNVPFNAVSGLDGEVVIVPSVATAAAEHEREPGGQLAAASRASIAEVTPDSQLGKRAARLRRPGGVVMLQNADGTKTAVTVRDPAVSVDR